jgi:hypothetical protein
MAQGKGLVIHGEVSASLLRNLEEFQLAWTSWRPEIYQKIDICSETESEQTPAGGSERTVLAFSGGVDSAFSAFYHTQKRYDYLNRTISAGLMVSGFDIPLDQLEVFDRAVEKSAQMLNSLGINIIPCATNFRELKGDWTYEHGAGIASCLMFLKGGYQVGMIASTEPYNSLVLPWGSNPITDPLMSSRSFEIVHDGASFNRTRKVIALAEWAEARRHLRVCWQGDQHDRNCGTCEKCIRTILNFRVAGGPLPECFAQDVTDDQIAGLSNLNSVQTYYLQEILETAKAANLSDPWVSVLEKRLRQGGRRRELRGSWLKRLRTQTALGTRLRRFLEPV